MIIKVSIIDAETDSDFSAQILIKKHKNFQFEIFVKKDSEKELRGESLRDPNGNIVWTHTTENSSKFSTTEIKKVVSAAHSALATLKQL